VWVTSNTVYQHNPNPVTETIIDCLWVAAEKTYLHFPIALKKAVQNLAPQAGGRRGGIAFSQQVHHRTDRLGINYGLQRSLPAGQATIVKMCPSKLGDVARNELWQNDTSYSHQCYTALRAIPHDIPHSHLCKTAQRAIWLMKRAPRCQI
jgi:hypothetical protein